MAKELKHVGKLKNTGSKVAVVFRTVPGESDQALVLNTAQLPDMYHDSLMTLIETDQAQSAFELGEFMFRNQFPNGVNMLKAVQDEGRLTKVPTSNVVMTPTPTQEVVLSELNGLIAEQKGVTVDQLYTFVSGAPKAGESADNVQNIDETAAPAVDTDVPADLSAQASTTEALSDADLAKSYRSQADAMYKEAARLRREADELDPPKKKTTKSKVAESA